MGRAAGTHPVTAVIDADNHYYEPDDAFLRHLDPVFSDRALHIRRSGDGTGRPYFGDQPLYYLERSPADRMGRPGGADPPLRPQRGAPAVDGRRRRRGMPHVAEPGSGGGDADA